MRVFFFCQPCQSPCPGHLQRGLPPVAAWWYSGAVAQWALGPVCTDTCAALVTSYTRYSSLWLWPMVAFDQLEGLLQCRGEVAPAMVVNVLFVLINVALNKVRPMSRLAYCR